MWLPTPVYERIPQFWLLLGLLFLSSGTYLGFDYSLSFAYFGMGFVCCIWSLWVFSRRLKARKAPNRDPIAQTTEKARDVDDGVDPAA